MYGQAEGYTERALVLYDGLHYDAMAQTGDPHLAAIALLDAAQRGHSTVGATRIY